MAERELLVGEELGGYAPLVGAALWRLAEGRERTLRLLDKIPPDVVDREVAGNSVGTILYHVALIELDWLCVDMLGMPEIPEHARHLIPVDDRDDEGRLSVIRGESLDDHRRRLGAVRQLVLEELRGMTDEDFRRPRPQRNYDVTPEWVLHHLAQHEAEHRGELGAVAGIGI